MHPCRHRGPECFKHARNVRLRKDIGSKQPFIKRFAPVSPQACDELVWGDQPVVRLHQDRCTIRTSLHSSACQRVCDEAIEMCYRFNHNSHEVTVHIIFVQVSQDLCGDLLFPSVDMYISFVYGTTTYMGACVKIYGCT